MDRIKLFFFLYLIGYAFSGLAFGSLQNPILVAADQVGNGGKSIVCRGPDGTIHQSQLLDFYEGNLLYGLSPVFSGGSPEDKALEAVNRIAILDPERGDYYRFLVQSFWENARFINAGLIDTFDSEHILAPPPGCEVEQLAVQITPLFPEDKLYTISRPIWDLSLIHI